jgi:hypothetical protein
MSPHPIARAGLRVVAVSTLLWNSAPLAQAQTRDDGALWTLWLGQGDLSSLDSDWKRVRWWLDVQDRRRDEGETFDMFLFRPGLGYALTPRVTAFLGYALIETDPANRDAFTEHRAWQQLSWNLPVEGFTLQSRTRLEQRFVEDESETGLRLRELVKATLPLNDSKSFFASVYDEVFLDVNDTDWGQRSGFRQNRAFVGLGWFLDRAHKFSLEVGYLNQWIDRPDLDRLNHALSLNLFMNF